MGRNPKKRPYFNPKTLGLTSFNWSKPRVVWLMHLCFINVTGNMITSVSNKLQLSSKLVQNMHLLHFNCTNVNAG